jgi:hypothetical protein
LRDHGLNLMDCVMVLLVSGLVDQAAAQNANVSGTPSAAEPVQQVKISFAD